MKTHNIECPICGTVNKGLYLDETNGWFECECCGEEVKVLANITPKKRIPVYTPEQLVRICGLAH